MGFLLALLAALAPAPAAGLYVAQVRETATALELEADGRYRWFYSQGALDLTSEGRWVHEGERLLLTSDPITPPKFSFLGASTGGQAGLTVLVRTAGGDPIPAVDVLLQYRSGKGDVGYTGSEGEYSAAAPKEPLAFVALALPAFELRSEDFKVDAKAGDTLTFQLEPNDIGKQAFDGEQVAITAKGLSLTFRGQRLDYELGEVEEVP